MKSAHLLYSFQSRQRRPNSDQKDLETLTPVIGLIGILFDSRTLLGGSEMWFLIVEEEGGRTISVSDLDASGLRHVIFLSGLERGCQVQHQSL